MHLGRTGWAWQLGGRGGGGLSTCSRVPAPGSLTDRRVRGPEQGLLQWPPTCTPKWESVCERVCTGIHVGVNV